VGSSKTYPLVFTFPEVIVGKGFVARVELHGQALLVDEGDGDNWIYGVQPGSVAGGGKDYTTACREFKKSYLSVLFDMALESSDYEQFKEEVEKLFATVNAPNRDAWDTALAGIRKTGSAPTGFGTVKAESRLPRLEIAKLDQRTMKPTINQFDAVEIAEAA
jgi:hypothetical protein